MLIRSQYLNTFLKNNLTQSVGVHGGLAHNLGDLSAGPRSETFYLKVFVNLPSVGEADRKSARRHLAQGVLNEDI